MAKHKTHYEDCDVLVVGGGWVGLLGASGWVGCGWVCAGGPRLSLM